MIWKNSIPFSNESNLLIMRKSVINLFVFIAMSVVITSCKIYRFTDASVDPNLKTYSVNPTINIAVIQNPRAASLLTEKLKDKFTSETRMDLVQQNADADFSCTITDYSVSPVILSDANTTAQNRLNVSVKVDFVNKLDAKKNFSQTFSDGENFDANKQLNDVENSKINDIFDRIVQQIFNKTFGNW